MTRLVLLCLLALALLVGCVAEEPAVFVEESASFFVVTTTGHPSHDYILCITAITENPECLSRMVED